MAEGGAPTPPTAVAEELLRLTSRVLAQLEQDEEALEAEQSAKRDALRQLVERDRAAVDRATERLNELYRAARAIADNKGRREVLEGILRKRVALDPATTFDELDGALRQELKLARGITGAMRVPQIGEMLNQAAVQVDHLEERADELEARLKEATEPVPEDSPARRAFAEARESLRADLATFAGALPLSARPWDDPAWFHWTADEEPTPYIRYGQFLDRRLDDAAVPALAGVPDDRGFVIEPARKRDQAVALARTTVVRLLTAFPPGGLRITFVDPKGHGDSAAGLVAPDGSGAGARVLTNEVEIDAELERLVERVGDPTATGPVEVVVVFDHPVGLSARGIDLVRELTDLEPGCRVFVIVVKDARTGSHPREARVLPSLRTIKATRTGFETEIADVRRPVDLDPPPPATLVEQVLAETRDAVPATGTDPLAPAATPAGARTDAIELRDPAGWWEGDAGPGLVVTAGTDARSAEPVVLSLDDRSIVMVSGPSEARHGCVARLALRYGPQQLQMQLVALGSSRLFEPYARCRLPHARAVGVEADRELAIGMLESVCAEVARRLVLFQVAGTLSEGFAGYRTATGNPIPRIVVVIDGAADLFAPDDPTARQARDLLDQLGPDGGPTGVHVVLLDDPGRTDAVASQLAGTDVTMLGPLDAPDADPRATDEVLRELRAHADRTGIGRSPTFVDGRVPADVEQAPLDLLGASGNGARSAVRFWLGEPATLGTPVEVAVTRAPGANVAVVTADPTVAQGMLVSAMVTAAIANGPALQVHVVDLLPLESGFAQIARALSRHARVAVSRRRTMDAALDAVRNQVVNRAARRALDAPPCLLVLNGIDRGTARADDDDVTPGELLRHLPQIVTEGPAVGVHTLVSGAGAEIERLVGSATLREFAIRVVGPMDEASALSLVDSAAPARLSAARALLYDEMAARVIRFRPYAMPSAEWVDSAVARYRARLQEVASPG